MTKTEAASILADDVLAFAHRHGLAITKDLAEARVSEWRGLAGAGSLKGAAAKLAHPATVLRIARSLDR